MNIEMIAIDADDTLWQAEINFQNAQKEFIRILSPWKVPDEIESILYEIEMKNLPNYGYGVKAFMLSMIEAAIEISNGAIGADSIDEIIAIGRSMLEAQVSVKPHVPQTLDTLSKKYPLMVITMGDLLDQTTKLTRSGLASYFSLVEVVNEKTPNTYKEIFQKYILEPQSFVMVGNSLKSDILPVLKLGGKAVHIPADTTWAHEIVNKFDNSHNNFYELDHFGKLPDLISKITQTSI